MRDEILSNLHDPGQLERLYRANKADFKQEFSSVYPQLSGNVLADFWHERLNYDSDAISWGSRKEFLFVAIAALVAGLLAKLPAIFPISEEVFYPRNSSFLVFPFLAAYFAWKNKLAVNQIAYLTGVIVVCLVYINSLPNTPVSDTLVLACIHLPLLLWVILGVSFAGDELSHYQKRLDFLRFNGDLAVMAALLVIAGGLMTGITLGLFSLIGFEIEEFYFEYVVAFGLPAVPIVATHLTQTNPQLVNKVSPVIAKLFSPLVLVMLVVYLGAIVFSGKDPYNDREFLLLFNVLLIGVMALIFFSVAESSTNEKPVSGTWVLLLLSIVTVVVNGIALSAISFRISEWGITPNRVAVLVGNLLMLVHLLLVTVMLYKTARQKAALTEVGRSIVLYIPVYFVWIVVVVFLFPLLFGFK
ncbi:uncharacterized protein DUF4153 [Pontibacter ummariensis]|uniref:DUF4153 domain-containing protein n=1 Tax=Pontibacter ummariensis TaxID=1610492 RepID=A0A239DEC7_9BACT|nr:DUF4153 domain-containing protein [Pontibacter ummariensis]PRY14383.1 uncharacterized protein DUF4153 [Pontibacter ummariensis]SNS30690.1 protein of unknown function [Pontibacter ummariensis]